MWVQMYTTRIAVKNEGAIRTNSCSFHRKHIMLNKPSSRYQHLRRSLTALLSSLNWVNLSVGELTLGASSRVSAARLAVGCVSGSTGVSTLLASLHGVDLALGELYYNVSKGVVGIEVKVN